MKKLIYVATIALAIASFNSVAYAKHDNRSDTYDTEFCQHIPPPRPTGGGTRERMSAIEQCNKSQPTTQQMPSTSSTEQLNQVSKHGNRSDTYDTEFCQHIPPRRPTGGGTRERMAAIEQCNKS